MTESSLDHLDDMEVYVACADIDRLVSWLENVFATLTITARHKHSLKFQCTYNAKTSSGMIFVNAGRTGFTSIWIDSRDTPWENDIVMGRALCQATGCTVRCVESAWQKGDDPDRWLEITADDEKIIQWTSEH